MLSNSELFQDIIHSVDPHEPHADCGAQIWRSSYDCMRIPTTWYLFWLFLLPSRNTSCYQFRWRNNAILFWMVFLVSCSSRYLINISLLYEFVFMLKNSKCSKTHAFQKPLIRYLTKSSFTSSFEGTDDIF